MSFETISRLLAEQHAQFHIGARVRAADDASREVGVVTGVNEVFEGEQTRDWTVRYSDEVCTFDSDELELVEAVPSE